MKRVMRACRRWLECVGLMRPHRKVLLCGIIVLACDTALSNPRSPIAMPEMVAARAAQSPTWWPFAWPPITPPSHPRRLARPDERAAPADTSRGASGTRPVKKGDPTP